jgi:hypothetical protein
MIARDCHHELMLNAALGMFSAISDAIIVDFGNVLHVDEPAIDVSHSDHCFGDKFRGMQSFHCARVWGTEGRRDARHPKRVHQSHAPATAVEIVPPTAQTHGGSVTDVEGKSRFRGMLDVNFKQGRGTDHFD